MLRLQKQQELTKFQEDFLKMEHEFQQNLLVTYAIFSWHYELFQMLANGKGKATI